LDDTQESKLYGISLTLATLAVAMVNIYGSRFVDGNLMSNFWIFAGFAARYRSLVLEARVAAPKSPAPDVEKSTNPRHHFGRPRLIRSGTGTKTRVV
jgi:hypothetical protein